MDGGRRKHERSLDTIGVSGCLAGIFADYLPILFGLFWAYFAIEVRTAEILGAIVRQRTRTFSDTQIRIGTSDLSEWLRSGAAKPKVAEATEEGYSIKLSFESVGSGLIRWQVALTITGRDTVERDGLIRCEYVPCNYGGKRLYFLCPESGKRCRTLYLDRRGFVSMQAAGLSYRSQSLNEKGRLKRRLRKIERRIGDDWSVKPKGMQHTTFDRLTSQGTTVLCRLDEIREAEEAKREKRLFNLCRRNNWL